MPAKASAKARAGGARAEEETTTEPRYTEFGKQSTLHFLLAHYPIVRLVDKLLDLARLDLNSQDHKGRTPLHLFVTNCGDAHLLAVMEAEELNYKYFLRHWIRSANIHLRDKRHNSATSILAVRGLFGMMEELCKLGGNVNNLNLDNVIPLQLWVKQNNLPNVKTLLALGADPNFIDADARTCLHHAVNVSQSTADASFELEQMLIRGGARANVRDKNGRTPLFFAFIKINRPFEETEIDPFETVSSLCALPDCEVNIYDKWHKSPLHYAAQRGSVISGRYLIKMHASVDVEDSDGNTPMAIAFLHGHSNIATMFIDNGADVSKTATMID
jgi:ankyrin repeat protein